MLKNIPLHWKVISGIVLGAVYAWLSITFEWNQFTIYYIKPLGDIFINVLKLIAVPMVLFSVILGVTSLKDINKLGKMGLKTLGLYVGTTMLAVTVGLVLVNLIKPGEAQDDNIRSRNRISYEVWRDANGIQKLDDVDLSNDEAYAEVKQTLMSGKQETNAWVEDKISKAESEKQNKKEFGPLKPVVDVVPTNIFQALADMSMLQIIFFAIFFGLVLVMIEPAKAEPVIKLVDGLNEVFVQMIWVVMKAMPIFVFALMAGQIVKAAGTDPDRFFELLDFLWRYSLVVVIGLLFMIFVFYPLLVTTVIKPLRYGRFMSGIRDAQVTAFSTSSSVATLPVTINSVHNKLGVSERTSSFVLPIGATVNMDGTSLYQAVAVVALAQFHMVDLTIAQQLTIIVTATLASIGAAAVPSAGLVLMIIVLESVGLNPAWIALIFPVDRILDMFRTVVNVTGDATVSSIVAHSEGELNIPED